MILMFMILIWVIMGVFVGMIANSRGHNPALWFYYGALIWPVALIHVSLLRPASESPASTPPDTVNFNPPSKDACARTFDGAWKK